MAPAGSDRIADSKGRRIVRGLEQNGLTARWEVPTDAQAARARRMLDELGGDNMTVEVVPG